MPYRALVVLLGAAPCQRRASKAKAVPAGPAAGTEAILWGTEGSGSAPLRWLPGTIRVAPFSSVKSVIIHMRLAAAIGASACLADEGSTAEPALRRASDGRGEGLPARCGLGIHHWSMWSGMVPEPGCWIWASTQEIR